MANQPKDPYKVLGVDQRAGDREIREAFRRIVLANHPDRFPDDAKKVERLREATEAYDILNDPEKRRSYDASGRTGFGRGAPAAVVDYFKQVFRTEE